jgi:ABC-type oligopeptide transport system ATPase subunit
LLVRPQEQELAHNTSDHHLVSVKGLKKSFSIRKSQSVVKAVDDVSFTIGKGECLGIVGESGSGKSTVAKLLLGIETPDAGEITVCGEPRQRKARNWKQRKQWGSQLQIVFQDPYSSLDPRQTPFDAISEVIRLHFPGLSKEALVERVTELLMSVGIHQTLQHSLPAELSGGQQQRVAIAKALAPEPEVIVLDEAVSGLDVSIQAQVLNLLSELQRTTGVSFLFISHDLAVIRQLCHRVIVMHHGKIVEQGITSEVLARPVEDYTKKLIDSVPRAGWDFDDGGS